MAVVVLAPLCAFSARFFAFALVCLGGLLIAALPANAEEAAPKIDATLADQVRTLALGQASGVGAPRASEAGAPRVEVVIGQLDPHLRLAPCDRIEPYLPPNVRLWGKSRIGLRCTQGLRLWNVYLPIVVKVWGRGLVVAAGIAAGSIVADADLAEAEVDLAEEITPIVLDRKLVIGRTLAQSLKPGQAVRQGHLKLRQWFAAGETVKVTAVGPGFALESEGQAISNGIEGTPARVRIESGRILTGQPSGERRIELAL